MLYDTDVFHSRIRLLSKCNEALVCVDITHSLMPLYILHVFFHVLGESVIHVYFIDSKVGKVKRYTWSSASIDLFFEGLMQVH